jgi:hypothetical protein
VVIMKNHALANASSTDAAGPVGSKDAFAEALSNLADAGIAFAEVPGCTHPKCSVCASRDLRHAA